MVLSTIFKKWINCGQILVTVFIFSFVIIGSRCQSPLSDETWNLNAMEGNLDEDFLIDHRFPTVISNAYSQDQSQGQGKGLGSSHFGVTVNLLKYSSQAHTWILIGEPKANWTQTFDKSGVIWKCGLYFNSFARSFEGNSNIRDYCEILEINYKVYGHDPPRYGKEWFGVSMGVIEPTNADPQLLSCAHRKRVWDYDKMSGACYVINAGQLQMTTNDNVRRGIDPYRLTQYYNVAYKYSAFGMGLNVNGNKIIFGAPGTETIGIMDVDSLGVRNDWEIGLYRKSGYYPYHGYAVTSGYYYSNTFVVSGCPRENWKGGVFVEFSQKDKTATIQKIQGFHLGSYFGSVLYTHDIDEDGIDELFIGAPNTGYLNPDFFTEQSHPYLREKEMIMSTFSPSSRKINSGNSNGNGNEGDVGCVYVYQNQAKVAHSPVLQVVQILLGNKAPFSRFGSAISSFSIPRKGDQGFRGVTKSVKKYIVIGAPYENGNEGAIYFYDTKTLLTSRKFSKRIAARQLGNPISSSKALAGFGFSFSNQRDVDGNGTPDLVIGSYLSNDVVLLRARHGITLRHRMKILFLSGKKRDQWEEKDLSNFIFKKIDPEFQLKVYLECSLPKQIRKNNAHLQFWSRIQVDVNEIDERYSISKKNPLEETKGSFKRINNQTIEFSSFLLNGISKQPVNLQELQTSGEEILEFVAFFRVTRIKTFEDNEFPPGLKITLKSWYNETQSLLRSRTEYRIIRNANSFGPTLKKSQENENQNSSYSTDHTGTDKFHPYLPSPALAKDVSGTVNILANGCHEQFACKPNLKISEIHFTTLHGQPLPLEGNGSSFTIGSSAEIILRWTITNENRHTESAITPGVFIKFSLGSFSNTSRKLNETNDEWSWSLLSKQDSSRCDQLLNDSRSQFGFRCNSTGILQPKQKKAMQIQLDMSGSGLYPKRIKQKLRVQLIPTHAHQLSSYPSNDNRDLKSSSPVLDTQVSQGSLLLLADAQVSIEGNRLPKKISKENTDFKHTYTIFLEGKSPVDAISLKFSFPVGRVSDIKNVVLVSPPEIISLSDGFFGLECNTTIPYSNSRFVTTNVSNKDRSKRNANTTVSNANVISKSAFTSGEKKVKENHLEYNRNETIELSCAKNENGSMICMDVQCMIPKVSKGTHFQIVFPMELSEDGYDLLTLSKMKKMMQIQSFGTAQIFKGDISKVHFDADVAEVIVELSLTIKNSQVPAWIFLVAGAGGLIVLIVLIFILYACGFFKRELKVQVDQMKAKKRDTLLMEDQELKNMKIVEGEEKNDVTEDTKLLKPS